jgi:hypothetical protein
MIADLKISNGYVHEEITTIPIDELKKLLPYHVKISVNVVIRHDDLVHDLIKWCHSLKYRWNFFREKNTEYAIFLFAREEDAIMFALRFI